MTNEPSPAASSATRVFPPVEPTVSPAEDLASTTIRALPQKLAEQPALILPFLMLVAVTLAVLWIFLTLVSPFLLTLLAAATLVLVVAPLQAMLTRKLGGRAYISAALITLGITLVVLVPLLVGVVFGLEELEKGIRFLQGWAQDHSEEIQTRLVQLDERFNVSKEDLRARVEEIGKSMLGTAIRFGQSIVARVIETTLHVGIGLFAIFFFLADGKRIIESWEETTPLDLAHDRVIRHEFATVCRGALWGTVLAALFQGVAMTLGLGIIELFTRAGLGRWLFLLGGLTTVAGLIPLAGASFVWVPTATVLFFNERYVAAALVVAFGFIVVSSIDNLVKIWVIRDSGNLHPLLVVVCVFGGLQWIGILGLFVGPAIGAIVFALLRVVKLELARLTGKEALTATPATAER